MPMLRFFHIFVFYIAIIKVGMMVVLYSSCRPWDKLVLEIEHECGKCGKGGRVFERRLYPSASTTNYDLTK